MKLKVNLGCGPVYVDNTEWINLDYQPFTSSVKQANLLDSLPLQDDSVSVVYSSHFLEHVPLTSVSMLLGECFRILESNGVIRLVLPDLENMAREYLQMREGGQHEKANFVVFELVDQCVRNETGGEMGRLYKKLQGVEGAANASIRHYIRKRVGEDLCIFTETEDRSGIYRKLRSLPYKLKQRIESYWIRMCVYLLPVAFRSQNISHASIGERHQWLWDFHQLKTKLELLGFIDVQRLSAERSTINSFPFYPLDIYVDGSPRKGENSMYIEARKP